MPREYRHLLMTNFRRIAHSPADAECMARLWFMQVILVCVAEAAQKTWFAGRPARCDPGTDGVPEESLSPSPAGTEPGGPELPPCHGIPRPALWDFFCGPGKISPAVPAPADGTPSRR